MRGKETVGIDILVGLFCVYIYKLIAMSLKKKKLYGPFFYGWGSTASRLKPLQGGSLLFTTEFPEIPSTHFIDLGWMKD